MSCGSKDVFKNPLCINIHRDVKNLVTHGMVKNMKT